MRIKGNNTRQANKMSIPYIIGFALLFSPLFYIGIIIIIGYIIFSYKKEAIDINKKETIDTNKRKNIAIPEGKRTIIPRKKFDASMKDLRDYEEYKRKNYLLEESIKPILKKRDTTNKCDVCRNQHSKPTTYCEVCKELLDDSFICTFCKTKNELNLTHCKNCGIKFLK